MRVGADVFAHCRRCGEVWHVVVAEAPDRKTRVECKQCGSRHNYHAPRSERAAALKVTRSTRRRARTPSPAPVEADPSRPLRAYDRGERYDAGDRVSHPHFGEGVVQAIAGPRKVRILFASGERTLAQALRS